MTQSFPIRRSSDLGKGAGHSLIDFATAIEDDWDKGKGSVVEQASLTLADDGTLTGSRQVNRWARGRHIHFAMQLSRKPDRVQFFGDGDKAGADGATSIKGNSTKLALFFDEAGGEPILIKTEIGRAQV